MARKSRKIPVSEPITTVGINTALYIRLSVEDGHGRSNSIENQQMILNDYVCDKPEFNVCGIYIEMKIAYLIQRARIEYRENRRNKGFRHNERVRELLFL